MYSPRPQGQHRDAGLMSTARRDTQLQTVDQGLVSLSITAPLVGMLYMPVASIHQDIKMRNALSGQTISCQCALVLCICHAICH